MIQSEKAKIDSYAVKVYQHSTINNEMGHQVPVYSCLHLYANHLEF